MPDVIIAQEVAQTIISLPTTRSAALCQGTTYNSGGRRFPRPAPLFVGNVAPRGGGQGFKHREQAVCLACDTLCAGQAYESDEILVVTDPVPRLGKRAKSIHGRSTRCCSLVTESRPPDALHPRVNRSSFGCCLAIFSRAVPNAATPLTPHV